MEASGWAPELSPVKPRRPVPRAASLPFPSLSFPGPALSRPVLQATGGPGMDGEGGNECGRGKEEEGGSGGGAGGGTATIITAQTKPRLASYLAIIRCPSPSPASRQQGVRDHSALPHRELVCSTCSGFPLSRIQMIKLPSLPVPPVLIPSDSPSVPPISPPGARREWMVAQSRQ